MARFICIILAAILSGTCGAQADVSVFPTGPQNPRVPLIAPTTDDDSTRTLPFETEFEYAFDPLVAFPTGGELSVRVRDNGRRIEKRVLTLQDGDVSLSLVIAPASKERRVECVVTEKTKEVARITLHRPTGWSAIGVKWVERRVSITQEGKDAGAITLATPFNPKKLALQTWHVTDLVLSGDGKFSLDWSNGYAARVQPRESGVQARALGFDTFVVSQNPALRDYPMLQLINGGAEARSVDVSFDLASEITGQRQRWRQQFEVPARSETFGEIRFPTPLATDIHHLTIDAGVMKTRKNFLFVARRPEKPGPPKFGLHDSGVKRFGTWPDALPIDVAHIYASWAYIQGPPWIKDYNGDYGIDPSLPPEEWNWPQRLDWLTLEGRLPYVCVQSTPFQDWQRSKAYPGTAMVMHPWGLRGGTPDHSKYVRFLRALSERYRGRVWAYEIENEPNTHHGFEPADYAQIVKTVSDTVRPIDPKPRLFGVSGTSVFVTWMQKVFAAGAASHLDGVSWHTYVTPALPDEVNLRGLLADVTQAMGATKPALAMLNSETGTYVAPREKIDEPIPDDRLDELVAKGQSPLAVTTGWPTRAMPERRGAISVITNALTNFLAGAEVFTFFGWNPDWPPEPKWRGTKFDYQSFSMISSDLSGERTPSRYTLAAAVLTAQMEPASPRGRRIDEGALQGGVFNKANGGTLAVLWSTVGPQSVVIRSKAPRLDVVTMYGQSSFNDGRALGEGAFEHLVRISDEPVYIHDDAGEMALLESPLKALASKPISATAQRVSVELHNTFAAPWTPVVQAENDPRWRASSAEPVTLAAGERKSIALDVELSPSLKGGRYSFVLNTQTPDARSLTVSAQLNVRPTFTVTTMPAATTARDLAKAPVDSLKLDRAEQVVVGQAPAMESLQDDRYWGGRDELSGEVKVATNGVNLLVYAEVTDAHLQPPKDWPGVGGSCAEFFFDFRTPEQGQGTSAYTSSVHQIIVRPALKADEPPDVWRASSVSKAMSLKVESGALSEKRYWIAITIPLRDVGITSGASIGFDLGIDGAKPEGGRKSQLILYGTALNNRDASRFGIGFIQAP